MFKKVIEERRRLVGQVVENLCQAIQKIDEGNEGNTVWLYSGCNIQVLQLTQAHQIARIDP